MKKILTCQQAAEYFTKQVLHGRGQYSVSLEMKEGDAHLIRPKNKAFDDEHKVVFIHMAMDATGELK